MKNECNVVRDLLPMYIDGVVSEDSRELVEEHVAQCHACKVIYAQMKDALPENGTQRDRQEFEQAARKLKIRRKRRTAFKVLLGGILGVFLLTVGLSFIRNYIYDMPLSEYSVSLSRMRNSNAVIMTIKVANGSYYHGYSTHLREDGVLELRLQKGLLGNDSGNETKIFSELWGRWEDGQWLSNIDTPYVFARKDGNGNEQLIYEPSQDIPYCSQEMEDYYKAEAELQQFTYSLAWRTMSSDDYDERYWELNSKVAQLRGAVPEWAADPSHGYYYALPFAPLPTPIPDLATEDE